jgi:hypothetical protein
MRVRIAFSPDVSPASGNWGKDVKGQGNAKTGGYPTAAIYASEDVESVDFGVSGLLGVWCFASVGVERHDGDCSIKPHAAHVRAFRLVFDAIVVRDRVDVDGVLVVDVDIGCEPEEGVLVAQCEGWWCFHRGWLLGRWSYP